MVYVTSGIGIFQNMNRRKMKKGKREIGGKGSEKGEKEKENERKRHKEGVQLGASHIFSIHFFSLN